MLCSYKFKIYTETESLLNEVLTASENIYVYYTTIFF